MRKHFLLLLWLTLLPLAGWAVNYGQIRVTWNNPTAGIYNGSDQSLPSNILNVAQYNNYGWQTVPASAYTIEWTYSGSDVVVARNAGTYTARITPTSGNSFTAASGYSLTHTWTMNKADNSVSVPEFAGGASWEYGQTPHAPSATTLDGTPDFYISANGTSGWQPYSNLTASSMPNTWYVKATVAETLNYNAAESSNAQVTITKGVVTVMLGNVTKEWNNPWDDPTMNEITPTVTGATTDWDDIKGYLKWKQLDAIGDVASGYSYTLESNGTTSDLYDIVVSGTGTLNIEKNTHGALGTAGDNLTALTYDDGKPLTLAPTTVPAFEDNKGNNAGTIEYKLGTGEWSAEPPTATEAGNYVVDFRGVGDQNHTDAALTGSYNVTINRRPITTDDYTLPTAVADLVYNGDPLDLHTALQWTNDVKRGEVEYWRNDVGTYASNIRWRDVAGNWTIRTRITPDANHIINGSTAATVVSTEDLPVSIAKADPEVDAAGAVYTDLVYTGIAQGLVESAPTFKGIAAGGTSQAVPGNITYYWNDGTTDRTATNIANVLATNKGDYPITFTFTPTGAIGNNFNSITIENALDLGTAVIAQAENEITTDPEAKTGLIFTGSAQKLIATEGVAKFGDVVYSLEEDGTYGAATDIEGTNAGEYTIYYKVVETDDYEGVDPLSFTATIEKATLNFGVSSLTVDWADGTTYEWANIVKELVTSDDWLAGETEAEQAAIMFKALNITVNGGAADDTNEDFVALLAGDAGVYNIALTANDDAEGVNYKIKLYNDATNVTINKIDASLAVLADAGKTYNGEDQDLVTITTAAVGADKVMYIVGGDTAPEADSEAWAEGIPQETNANTYNVWQKVVGDKNHNDVVATAAVVGTIAPKNIADAVFTIDPAEKVYTGENQNTTEITVVPDDAEPMDVDKDIKSITLPADVTSFGEYDVTIEGQGNYTGTTTVKFSITQAENKAEVTIAGWTYGEYDEEVNAPKVTADFGAETVKYTYSKKDADDWKDEVPTEFGEYTVKATIAETPDYAAAEATADFAIAKANAVIDPATAAINLTYNGKDQALVKAAGSDDGTFKYQVLNGEKVVVDWTEDFEAVVAKNAGNYTVNTEFIPDDNHLPATVEPVTVTINKAEISYVLGNISKVWDGAKFDEEQINSLFAINYGELFEDDKYDRPFEFILPDEYKDAGEYSFTDVDYEFKKDYPENYDVKFTGTANIVINKADIYEGEGKDYIAPAAIKTNKYDFGTLMDLVTPGTVNTTYLFDGATEATPIGTILFATEEDGEYTEDVPQGALATDYVVWYYVKGDKNHNDTKPVKIDATIAQYELTEAFLPDGYEDGLVKPYKAAAYAATDFISALDGIELDEGYTVTPSAELKETGKYTLTYAGINNLTGGFTVDVEIEALKVVASAPKGVKKVYDGTASLENAKIGEKALSNEDISFNGVLDTDKLVLPTTLALSTEGINVSDESYAIKVDASAFEGLNKNYIISDETIDGDLTITKAPAIKIGIATYPVDEWTKVYGEAEPEKLTGYTLAVTGGEVFADDLAKVLEASTAKRAEGDDVDTYAVSLVFDETAEVFKNYEGVSFDEEMTGEFTITKSTKTYTVSLANITETYTGEEFATAIEFTAADLVIAGYTGELAKFFDEGGLPTASIAAGAKTVGNYNITLDGGKSKNYNFEFIPATFTIEPFKVTTATIENQKVQKGKELDETLFTIVAPETDADLFYVTAPGLVDLNDIVTGDAGVYKDGLVLAVDASVADNYTGLDKFTGRLEIFETTAGDVILADTEGFASEEDQNGVDVSFADRSINAGNWNVVALPFEATITQISDAFGYAAVDVLDESNAKTDEVHFMIKTSGSIPAYTPFIVKTTTDKGYVKNNFSEVVFYNVNVKKGDGENKAISDAAGNQFIGTFKPETKIWGEKYRYMAGGAWYNAKNFTESNPAIVKAFRGYIEMVSASGRIFIEEPDGTVTAIDAVEFNKGANEGMYNLNGVKVNNANRKGVFIQNGKKVIKK